MHCDKVKQGSNKLWHQQQLKATFANRSLESLLQPSNILWGFVNSVNGCQLEMRSDHKQVSILSPSSRRASVKRAWAATICGNLTLTLHSILMWRDKQIEAEKYQSEEITQALAIALCDKKIYTFIQFCTLITAWSFSTNSLQEPRAGIRLSCCPFLTFAYKSLKKKFLRLWKEEKLLCREKVNRYLQLWPPAPLKINKPYGSRRKYHEAGLD